MPMTDREMLLLLYGAIKVQSDVPAGNLERIARIAEDHLFPGDESKQLRMPTHMDAPPIGESWQQ